MPEEDRRSDVFGIFARFQSQSSPTDQEQDIVDFGTGVKIEEMTVPSEVEARITQALGKTIGFGFIGRADEGGTMKLAGQSGLLKVHDPNDANAFAHPPDSALAQWAYTIEGLSLVQVLNDAKSAGILSPHDNHLFTIIQMPGVDIADLIVYDKKGGTADRRRGFQQILLGMRSGAGTHFQDIMESNPMGFGVSLQKGVEGLWRPPGQGIRIAPSPTLTFINYPLLLKSTSATRKFKESTDRSAFSQKNYK